VLALFFTGGDDSNQKGFSGEKDHHQDQVTHRASDIQKNLH
jgi:hypothetical protein